MARSSKLISKLGIVIFQVNVVHDFINGVT